MRLNFHHIALIGKYQTVTNQLSVESSRTALDHIAHFLHDQGCSVTIESETARNTGLTQYARLSLDEIGAQCDLALVVGGDGTMLGVGRQLARYKTPLIGINQGRLGFITDVPLKGYESTLEPMLHGQYQSDSRPLITAQVIRQEKVVFEAMAMNDVVVNRGSTSGMVELRVGVDGQFLANQRADGLIVASPTGSTAYAMSAGGPMLHPALPGWVLVPIAPHTLTNRPIVLPDASEIVIEVVSGRDISANFDMQSLASLLHGDRIHVKRSEHSVCFLHPQGWSYFETLQKKLGWNERG